MGRGRAERGGQDWKGYLRSPGRGLVGRGEITLIDTINDTALITHNRHITSELHSWRRQRRRRLLLAAAAAAVADDTREDDEQQEDRAEPGDQLDLEALGQLREAVDLGLGSWLQLIQHEALCLRILSKHMLTYKCA